MTLPIAHLSNAGRLDRMFIDGEWTLPDPLTRSGVVDPSTEESLAEIALGSTTDVDTAVAAARRAFAGWAATSPESRARLLDRVHALILERAELFAQAISLEMGAAIGYARGAQVPLAAEHIRVARDNLATYPFVTHRGTTAILREPIGVCGLITPWNWPLYQITAKVGAALAAGCTVVLKPSELSPLSALLFAEVVQDAGIPPGVFNLVNGDGPGVGAALSAHPDVDMISLTGSTRAGVLVSQAAAPTVKRVALELGGKSPNVVFADADLDAAVKGAYNGIFYGKGEVCAAGSRLFIEEPVKDELVERLVARTKRLVPGDPLDPRTKLGALVSRKQRETVLGYVEEGKREGARVVHGGGDEDHVGYAYLFFAACDRQPFRRCGGRDLRRRPLRECRRALRDRERRRVTKRDQLPALRRREPGDRQLRSGLNQRRSASRRT